MEEALRGTFNGAPVGIALVDFEARFARTNRRYVEITGYADDELLGRTLLELTHPDDRAAMREHWQPVATHASDGFSLEHRALRKDGSAVWVDLSLSLYHPAEGKPRYAIAIIQDIDRRKRLESELLQSKRDADAANLAKDELLANVSHEIRTPMNAILGMTELVLESELESEQRQHLATVRAAAVGLLDIVNDLLDYSKIEAGKVELELRELSLRELLHDVLWPLEMRARRQGLGFVRDISPNVPDRVIGDSLRLRQILTNLVGNAIKFTETGEVGVAVTLESSADDDIELRWTVRDTGIGIAADKQATVFRAFEQEDASTTRRFGGTGLGLTITARLVEMMRGRISVVSTPGRGSSFTFTTRLQERPRSEPVATPVAERVRSTMRRRVLIVEDNEFNAQLLEQLLRKRGQEPFVAPTAQLARAALAREPFDILLLDLHMPDVDGFELIAQLRTDERQTGQHLPIIALTARSRPEDRARCLAAGADEFLAKPVHAAELFKAIERLHPEERSTLPLVDRHAVWSACGGDGQILEKIVVAFCSRLPEQLKLVETSFRLGDAHQLREAAHRISSMLGAFSTRASMAAQELEDVAASGRIEAAGPLVLEIATMADDLAREVAGLTVEQLRAT